MQAKPQKPFIADLIASPELAGAPIDTDVAAAAQGNAAVELAPLTADQRHSLKWVYAVFLVLGWIAQLPLGFALPYYYIYIMQRLNQDLRVALVGQWHQLSMRYHSNHRVGDSVYRIYQDSSQVTAVIGELTQALQVLITYFTGIVFCSRWILFWADGAVDHRRHAHLGALVLPAHARQLLASRQANSNFTSRVQETFSSTRLIKAFGAEARSSSASRKTQSTPLTPPTAFARWSR